MNQVQVTVEYYAQVRVTAGRAIELLAFDSRPTLVDLVRKLIHRHGPAMEALLWTKNRELARSVIFAVNGRQMAAEENAYLNDGDTVVIVPPISGGAR